MSKRISLLAILALTAGLAFPGAVLAQTTAAGGGGTGAPTTAGGGATGGGSIDLPIGAGHLVTPEEPPKPPPTEDNHHLYGEDVPIKNNSVIFVIDTSGSMDMGTGSFTGLDGQPTSGSRLDRAKIELTRAISGLTDNISFNCLHYGCDVSAWQPSRVKADAAHKASAIGWVGALYADDATGTGPAMAQALAEKDNMTVVLLSDGSPNCIGWNDGSIQQHLNMINQNNTQKASISCFGIGAYGRFEQFLRDVAADNSGQYYSVN